MANYHHNSDEIIEEEDTSCGCIIKTPFSPSDIDITTPPMNMGDLIDMITAGWINFQTKYQRTENLWSPGQQSRLIESAMLGLRLPAFYFEAVSKREWNIIDGLQRCCSIKNFCVDKTLALCELEFISDVFDGKKYEQFEFETKRDLRMLPITVNVLEKGTPPDVKYILFKRLNTGGIALNAQEIRCAVLSGRAIDVVYEMSCYEEFREATRNKLDSRRKQDMDFVSRFVSFYVTKWNDYEPDLESHINKSMKFLNNDATDEYIEDMKSAFRASMVMSSTIFGDRAFGKQENSNDRRRPMNKAYFEVISTLFARLNDNERTTLIERKELLIGNLISAMHISKSYRNSYSGGTGSKESVTKRFSWVDKIINITLSNHKVQIYDNKIEAI